MDKGIHRKTPLRTKPMNAVAIFSDMGAFTPPSAQDAGDAELMGQIRSRDTAAFETLYKGLYPRLFRFIFRMIRQADLTEDLINETMLVVWEKPEGFNFSCKVSTWVFGIAYRKTLKACSKVAQADGYLSVDEFAEVLPDRNLSLSRQVELENLLAVALDSLSQEQRAVIELTCYHGLPYQDVAAILGCPENTVKTRMFHARKKLQPFLQDLRPEPQNYFHEDTP